MFSNELYINRFIFFLQRKFILSIVFSATLYMHYYQSIVSFFPLYTVNIVLAAVSVK